MSSVLISGLIPYGLVPLLSMAIKGYKVPLEAKDLWSLNQRDSSSTMVPKLLREWEKEQTKARR